MHQWPTSAHSEPPVLCFAHLTLFIAHQLDQLGPDYAFTRCMAELTRQHAATPQPQGPALPHCGRLLALGHLVGTYSFGGRGQRSVAACALLRFHIRLLRAREWADGGGPELAAHRTAHEMVRVLAQCDCLQRNATIEDSRQCALAAAKQRSGRAGSGAAWDAVGTNLLEKRVLDR
jgi:hypothetical protein